MQHDPAKELDDLASAYEEAAARLRHAAAGVRTALSGARQATLEIDIPAATETRKVEIREIPFTEMYKGKSQGDAAEAYINSMGRPVDKSELFTALKERGVRMGSRQSFSVALSRHPTLDFVKGEGWTTRAALLAMTKRSLDSRRTSSTTPKP
jgi:hypothetical protein